MMLGCCTGPKGDRIVGRLEKSFRMIIRLLPSTALVIACVASASAQVQTINRTISGKPDTDIRIGVYINVRPDCTTGPLPAIQLTTRPKNGKVIVKQVTVKGTNYKQCLA